MFIIELAETFYSELQPLVLTITLMLTIEVVSFSDLMLLPMKYTHRNVNCSNKRSVRSCIFVQNYKIRIYSVIIVMLKNIYPRSWIIDGFIW